MRNATEQMLRKLLFWSTLSRDVQSFVQAYIHCLSIVAVERVPQLFGIALHGKKAYKLLQFDYIEHGLINDGDKYVLMLRDDHSDYKLLYAFADTVTRYAVQVIISWCVAFGSAIILMSVCIARYEDAASFYYAVLALK